MDEQVKQLQEQFGVLMTQSGCDIKTVGDNLKTLYDRNRGASEIEAGVISVVSAEMNADTGKPLYTNDRAREPEKTLRLENNEDYNHLREEIASLEADNWVLKESIRLAHKQMDFITTLTTIVSHP